MPVFKNTEELYRVMGALFERLRSEPEISEKLAAGDLVVQFQYRDPDGVATIDLTRQPIEFEFGESSREPDVRMTSSADVAHQFWLGRLNVPRAIATRKIIARGSVPKALKLLPAVKPAFDIYPQVLREMGYGHLLDGTARQIRQRRRPGIVRTLSRIWPFAKRPRVDLSTLPAPPIELVDAEQVDFQECFADQALPDDPKQLQVEMLRRMRLIRAFEQTLAAEFQTGNVPAEALHLSIGQEASAVGACFALRTQDYIATTHRGHGHLLAKGVDPNRMMAEIFGKATGSCKGKGGCMHVAQADVGALGANGIVGASALICIGAAHSARLRGTDQVALCFLGDGATNHGMFHEAVNFAAVFDLPAVFVIENNQYAEFTPAREHARLSRLSERAAAYGIPGTTVDGNDVWAVYTAVSEAVARARRGEGPSIVECMTYRISGHTEGESARYRSEEERRAWQARCPIQRWEKHLLKKKVVRSSDLPGFEEEARQRVREALEFAKQSSEPSPEELNRDIFSPEPRHLWTPVQVPGGGREITFSEALREAMAEEMRRDDRVYLLGEDVTAGGYFAVTAGLVDEFGPRRVIDTPISEYAIVGSAVAAAMTGMRPIAEIQFSDFLTCCMDPLVNQAPKLRYMSGGQFRLPLVVRTPGGAGIGMAAQHSQSLEAWLMGIPGLIIVAPGTPADAKGLLKAAIRSNNPVLFFENKLLYLTTGRVPEAEYIVPLGVADVKRPGNDVTLVALGSMLPLALEAAAAVEREVSVEVVDPRTVKPLDLATLLRSVEKTRRLVVAEEGHLTHGFGAEVIARICEHFAGGLISPPARVAALDVPIPYNRALENAVVPDVERLVQAVRRVMGNG